MTCAVVSARRVGRKPPRVHREDGAVVASQWVPRDVWLRLATAVHGLREQQALSRVCTVAAAVVDEMRNSDLEEITRMFRVIGIKLPDAIMGKVLMVHAVPGGGVIMFLDESQEGGGVDVAWLMGKITRRVSLGLELVPATAVSNIRFSPDGRSVAFLVTLAHGAMVSADDDPLRRLRGWGPAKDEDGSDVDVKYEPCEDCTVQVVDLLQDDSGAPTALLLHTFSHVFVPEYGFDMVWRAETSARGGTSHQELAFAAMLHSETGAATYLVRWKTFRDPTASNYIFMACVEGASSELLEDKKIAMMTRSSTLCTSRIEIADDARHIFFDTMSKFGILRFDQTENARDSKVTRADLPNDLIAQLRRMSLNAQPSSFSVGGQPRGDSECKKWEQTDERGHAWHSPSGLVRISRMSPDGSLLCSVVSMQHLSSGSRSVVLAPKQIEMRSSLTGHLIYRRLIVQHCESISKMKLGTSHLRLEKSSDVAHHTLGFSDDSSIVLVWDTLLTRTHCVVVQRLPVVLDSRTGGIIQDFGALSGTDLYECLQMASDARIIYGTRLRNDQITMDAIDVLSGRILKTVIVTGPVHPPKKFSLHAVYLFPNGQLRTVTGAHMNGLWDMTRGSLGCGWRRPGVVTDHDDCLFELLAGGNE